MADSNTLFLQIAAALMSDFDRRYAAADREAKMHLKEAVDKAMMTFSEIRCKILENETVCTPENVTQMQVLRQELGQIAEIPMLLGAIARFTRILAGL